MQLTRILTLAVAAIAVPLLSAQSLTTNFTVTLAQNASGQITGTGSGTSTPGGATTAALTVITADDNFCRGNIQIEITLTAANGDKLNVRAFGPDTDEQTTVITIPLTFNILGGTGQFAGKGGSGSGSVAVTFSTLSATVSLTGNITNTYTPTATIRPAGIVPVYSSIPRVQPGSWVSVYGDNLANSTVEWDGRFPTTLGGVSATVNGKPAYLWFVSAGQINMQLPNETLRGCADIRVTTPNGVATIQTELSDVGPSFSLLDARYPAAIILTPNGSGAYGVGSYDIAGAPGRYSYNTRRVRRGETLVLYGVGFGPTATQVPAGAAYSGASAVPQSVPIEFTFGNTRFRPPFVGIVGAGLYQVNLTVPANAPSGDVNIQMRVLGQPTQNNIFVTVE